MGERSGSRRKGDNKLLQKRGAERGLGAIRAVGLSGAITSSQRSLNSLGEGR